MNKELKLKHGIPANFVDVVLSDNGLGKTTEKMLGKDTLIKYKEIYSASFGWVEKLRKGDDNPHGLFLLGPTGSGKTGLGCAICNYFLDIGWVARRVTLYSLVNKFFEKWKTPSFALKPGILFIDEISRELPTKEGHNQKILENVLKYRIDHKYVTIISSIKGKDSIGRQHGEVISNLIESNFFDVLFPQVNISKILKEDAEERMFG